MGSDRYDGETSIETSTRLIQETLQDGFADVVAAIRQVPREVEDARESFKMMLELTAAERVLLAQELLVGTGKSVTPGLTDEAILRDITTRPA